MRIDTHCHIDRFKNPSEIADNCEAQRVLAVAVTNLPSHYEIGHKHVAQYQFVRLALGLHPLNAAKYPCEVDKFCELAPTADYIGEIGLDFSREGRATRDEQIVVFASILHALQGPCKLITLHSRRAEAKVLEMLTEHEIGPAIFHWYSGGLRTLHSVIESGHYVSINPAMTRSANSRSLIERMPKDKVLTETDGPYVKCSRRPAIPCDVDVVLKYLSQLWEANESEIEQTIESNYLRLTGGLYK